MKEYKRRYWHCIIGPVNWHNLPAGANSSMRSAVANEFGKITSEGTFECWSGWGINEAEKEAILAINIPEEDKEPRPDLATTAQLIDELRARVERDGKLEYRTIDEGR